MEKYEIEKLVNNFEHGLRVMESDPNVKTYRINNMTICNESNGYYITIINTIKL